MGKTAVRVAGLRAMIVETALSLFLERGFEAVTMSEIAIGAGVPRRSLFRYFASKDEIVFASVDQREGAFMRGHLGGRARGTHPVRALRAAFVALARQEDTETQSALIKTRLIFDTPALAARMYHEVSRWQSEFTVLLAADGLSPADWFAHKVRVAAVTAAYITAVRAWAENGEGEMAPLVVAAFDALKTDLGE